MVTFKIIIMKQFFYATWIIFIVTMHINQHANLDNATLRVFVIRMRKRK